MKKNVLQQMTSSQMSIQSVFSYIVDSYILIYDVLQLNNAQIKAWQQAVQQCSAHHTQLFHWPPGPRRHLHDIRLFEDPGWPLS